MDDLVKQLLHATVSIDGDFDVGCNVRDAAVERLERSDAAITRANAAPAAAYEVAAQIADDFVRMRERQIETEKEKAAHHVDVPQIMRWQAGKVQSEAITSSIRALATPDQTAALDKLIAEAVKPYVEALREIEMEYDPSDGGANARSMYDIARTASKKVAP